MIRNEEIPAVFPKNTPFSDGELRESLYSFDMPCYEAFRIANRQAEEYDGSRENCLINEISNEQDEVDRIMLLSPY